MPILKCLLFKVSKYFGYSAFFITPLHGFVGLLLSELANYLSEVELLGVFLFDLLGFETELLVSLLPLGELVPLQEDPCQELFLSLGVVRQFEIDGLFSYLVIVSEGVEGISSKNDTSVLTCNILVQYGKFLVA